jgi:hypothetical protein
MHLRFYIDPETDQPHIYGHDVSEEEVEEVLARPGEVGTALGWRWEGLLAVASCA